MYCWFVGVSSNIRKKKRVFFNMKKKNAISNWTRSLAVHIFVAIPCGNIWVAFCHDGSAWNLIEHKVMKIFQKNFKLNKSYSFLSGISWKRIEKLKVKTSRLGQKTSSKHSQFFPFSFFLFNYCYDSLSTT